MKIVLLAPIHNSLYARLVASELAKEKEVRLTAIIVRSPWNLRRFRSEFKRDEFRLFRKIYQKLVRGDDRFSNHTGSNLAVLAQENHLLYKSLKDIARELRIPYMVVPDHNHPRSLELVSRLSPDAILFTGGGLLREAILSLPRMGVLNCHTGILPYYRGMDVVEWAVLEEVVQTIGLGVTLHMMDKGVDTGPILLKEKLIPPPGSSFETIRAQLEVMMVRLMIKGVKKLQNESLTPKPQDIRNGRQYFVMHPRIKHEAETRLGNLK